MTDQHSNGPRILQRIAQALDVPEACLREPVTMPVHLSGPSDCLQLWSRLRTDEQRRRALAYLQALADETEPSR